MGKFDNIFIISDIDFTFLASDRSIPERNIKALEYFKSNGGKFTFATGRSHSTLLEAFPNAGEMLNAPGILGNGTYMYDFRENKPTHQFFIDKDIALKAGRFILDFYSDTGLRMLTPDCTIYSSINKYISKELENPIYKSSAVYQDPKDWTGENWHKMVVRDDPQKLVDLRKAMEKEFCHGELEFVNSEADFFEIQPFGCQKGRGIEMLRQEYQKKGETIKIYACGDYENVLSMLLAADVSICPSNAHGCIKAVADYCLCSCSEGLIGDIVEHLDNGQI
jgi:Cof subfamily protein (haloacid dehalogenase superfamily)